MICHHGVPNELDIRQRHKLVAESNARHLWDYGMKRVNTTTYHSWTDELVDCTLSQAHKRNLAVNGTPNNWLHIITPSPRSQQVNPLSMLRYQWKLLHLTMVTIPCWYWRLQNWTNLVSRRVGRPVANIVKQAKSYTKPKFKASLCCLTP